MLERATTLTENASMNVLNSTSKRLMARMRIFVRRPEVKEMASDLLERVAKVYQRIKATIKVISRSLLERGKMVAETAVRNDVRPDAYLACNETSGIYKNKAGSAYGEEGARSSLHLIQNVGPAPLVVDLPFPLEFASQGNKFRWTILDDQWEFPNSSMEKCAPLLKREPITGADNRSCSAWETASRILNAVLRHGTTVTFIKGGWVSCTEAIRHVKSRLRKTNEGWLIDQIASVHWLFGLLHDKTVKPRFQLAGIVDKTSTLVKICYVRCKSGHNKEVAKLIPNDSIYSKIEARHLHLISCICHKTKFENILGIFSMGFVPGGVMNHNNRAHSNFTPFPPFDDRNIASGRPAGVYDVMIIFNKEMLIKYDLRMSMSAI